MWEQIRFNQIRSIILVAGMGVLLLLLGYVLGLFFLESGIAGLIIAGIIWVVMNLIAYFRGGSVLLAMSGAKKIGRNDHPRLYNIVEEMKIASGLEHMPNVYIIDDPAPNAFATGRSPKNASVAVTSGLLQKLNRDELQGVVGHEIAHVKNRDILLMSMAGVILGTVVILAWYATRMLFFGSMVGGRRSSRSGGGQGQMIIMVVGIVLMILAPIAAQMLYFAISRKREYLADASSALYTRYPQGMASALEKISGSTVQLKTANKATAPMFTVNPFRSKGMAARDLTSTHPPISERIRILQAMGGASAADYDRAYKQTKGAKSSVIPASALASTETTTLRAAAEAQDTEEASDAIRRTRDTSDLMWRLGHYSTIVCDCGTKLRVPAKFKEADVRCPHCNRLNPVGQPS